MLLDDLVFRVQHYANDNWELGDACFLFYKIEGLVDQYAKFWSLREDFRARNVLELGMWDGGISPFGSNISTRTSILPSTCSKRKIASISNVTNSLEVWTRESERIGE